MDGNSFATLSGAGGLVKAGPGFMEVRERNTYTGPTTVVEGNLLVRNALASPVTVNSGGILNGNFRFGQGGPFGDVTVNGGTIDPGNDHSGGDFGPREPAGIMLSNGD